MNSLKMKTGALILSFFCLGLGIEAQKLTPSEWKLTEEVSGLGPVDQSHDGQWLAYGKSNEVQVIESSSNQNIRLLSHHSKNVTHILFGPEKKILASASKDGTIKAWSCRDWELTTNIPAHSDAITHLAFHPSGQILASVSLDGTMKLWLIEKNHLLATLPTNNDEIASIRFGGKGNIFIVENQRGKNRLWKLIDFSEQPADAISYYRRAQLRKIMGDLDGAIDDFFHTVKFDSNYGEAYYAAACVFSLRSSIHSSQSPEAQKADISKAIYNLEMALDKGFKQKEAVLENSDLRFLHYDSRFQALVKKQGWSDEEEEGEKMRAVLLKLTKEGDKLIEPWEVLLDGKKVSFDEKWETGKEYNLEFRFREHRTVKQRFWLDPGKEPYSIHIPMRKLKEYSFILRGSESVIDGINYPYTFYTDSVKLEDHHIQIAPGKVFRECRIWTEFTAQKLRIYSGYLYTERSLMWLKGRIGRLEEISISHLMTHLDRVARQDQRGYQASLLTLERMLKSPYWSRKFKSLPLDDILKLLEYVEKWDLPGSYGNRVQMMVDVLEEFARS